MSDDELPLQKPILRRTHNIPVEDIIALWTLVESKKNKEIEKRKDDIETWFIGFRSQWVIDELADRKIANKIKLFREKEREKRRKSAISILSNIISSPLHLYNDLSNIVASYMTDEDLDKMTHSNILGQDEDF